MLRFRITALTVLLLSCLGVVQAKVDLVAVGISDYPGTRNDLRLPANDAKTIAWLYSKNTAVEYTLLINDEATQSAISTACSQKQEPTTSSCSSSVGTAIPVASWPTTGKWTIPPCGRP